MDLSRSVKRLVMIVVLAIIVILISKSLLTRTAKTLRIQAEKKRQAKVNISSPVSAAEDTSIGQNAGNDTLAITPESAPVTTEGSASAQ